MDIYLKTLAGALIALVLCLTLAGVGKDYSLLLGTLVCCMIAATALLYLDPVITFFHELESMIPLDNGLLRILLKTVGIGLVGEIASMICVDSGNSALGKTLQLLTSVMILWLSLPLFRSLLELIQDILEGL